MPNFFAATDDFFDSLQGIRNVAIQVVEPNSIISAQRDIANAVSCASVVLLSGYFESFLKAIVQEYIQRLNALKRPLASIPKAMVFRHLEIGGQLLFGIAKQGRKADSTADATDFALRIASIAQANNYELAWEAFSDTKSNPGPAVVKSILKDLTCENSWDEINKLSAGSGQLNLFLESFIEMRNICAHTGAHSNPPTGQMLVEYSNTFETVSECIDFLMALRLEAL